jgi:hypothetical protein
MLIKIQPAIKNKPPIGVMGPNTFNPFGIPNKLRVHKKYKEPENITIPIKKLLNAQLMYLCEILFRKQKLIPTSLMCMIHLVFNSCIKTI